MSSEVEQSKTEGRLLKRGGDFLGFAKIAFDTASLTILADDPRDQVVTKYLLSLGIGLTNAGQDNLNLLRSIYSDKATG